MNSFHFRGGWWKYYASCPLHTILFMVWTCAQRTRSTRSIGAFPPNKPAGLSARTCVTSQVHGPRSTVHFSGLFLPPSRASSHMRFGDKIRFNWIKLSYFKETSANSKQLRIDESSRTSLIGLSVLLRNAMFIFILQELI